MEKMVDFACSAITVNGQEFRSEDNLEVHISPHPNNEEFAVVCIPNNSRNFFTLLNLNQSFAVDDNGKYLKFHVMTTEITDVVR